MESKNSLSHQDYDQAFAFKFKDDFPYNVAYVSFARYSYRSTSQIPTSIETPRKNIIVGGCEGGQTTFHEIILDKSKSSECNISYKSFEKDYNKKNGNLKIIGMDNADYIASYLLHDNKYLIVIHSIYYYNVYDLLNDKWLIKGKGAQLSLGTYTQSVLINETVLVNTTHRRVNFYWIDENDMTNPLLIKEYKMKKSNVWFESHGVCCIDCKENSFKLVLFGGMYETFLSSFLILDCQLKLGLAARSGDESQVTVKETSIDENDIELSVLCENKYENVAEKSMIKTMRWTCFSVECVMNRKNEAVIILCGGFDMQVVGKSLDINKWIGLFNVTTKQMIIKQNVKYSINIGA